MSPVVSSVKTTPVTSPEKVDKKSKTSTTTSSKYDDLHEEISPVELRARAKMMAHTLTDVVRDQSGLNVTAVDKCGSGATGLSNLKDFDAESTFYVPDLPSENIDAWMPTLCESVAEHISPLLAKVSGVESVDAVGNAVEVSVRLAPELECMKLRCRFAAEISK